MDKPLFAVGDRVLIPNGLHGVVTAVWYDAKDGWMANVGNTAYRHVELEIPK